MVFDLRGKPCNLLPNCLVVACRLVSLNGQHSTQQNIRLWRHTVSYYNAYIRFVRVVLRVHIYKCPDSRLSLTGVYIITYVRRGAIVGWFVVVI